MIVIGEKERDEELISVRSKSGGDMGKRGIGEFISMVRREIDEKVR
jgi:threonyl-tRNA synthetase